MKVSFTTLFSAKCLALSLFFCAPMVAMAQVFSQDFSAGGTLSTYFNASPTTNQFDYIGPSGSAPASTIYFTSGALVFQRGNTAVAFARTTDFSPTPNVLKIKFKLLIPFSTVNAGNMASIVVGSGFAASATGEVGANQHSRITLSFPTASGTFQLRNTATTPATNSPEFTGTQDITWVINNSGASINYTDPAGGSSSLADDFADVWVGTSRVLTNAAITATQSITDFKFLFNNGSGAVRFDDFVITKDNDVALPVTLTSFTAKKANATNQLAWATASEQNASHYTIERSSDAKNFTAIGKVKAQGTAANYKFTDEGPLSISYYRLRQVDLDGTEELSKIVSVSQSEKGYIKISPNPTSDRVNIQLNQNDVSDSNATLILYDMTGRQVLTQRTTTEAIQLDLSNLTKGMYVLTVQSNNAIYQEKIIRQ